jgi:DNA primase catalytic subunit
LDIKSIAEKYYKRREIQEAILENAKDREIAVKFGDKGFGTRPDVLQYPRDVLELVKQGATSFHASEEVWRNPLHLNAEMKKRELDELRTGWDLVLDIDCPDWELAKISTWILIKA